MDDSQEIPLTEHQRHWLEHLRACKASGKGIAAYAREHDIDAKALYAGKKVLIKKGVSCRIPAVIAFSVRRLHARWQAVPSTSSCLMACR